MGLVGVTLPRPDHVKRIVDAHAEYDDGEHQGRNVQCVPGEFHGAQGGGQGKNHGQQGHGRQPEVEKKEKEQHRHAQPDDHQHPGEGGKEQFPQPLGKQGRIENRSPGPVFFVKPPGIIGWARGKTGKLHPDRRPGIFPDAQKLVKFFRDSRVSHGAPAPAQGSDERLKSISGKPQFRAHHGQLGPQRTDASGRPEGLPGRCILSLPGLSGKNHGRHEPRVKPSCVPVGFHPFQKAVPLWPEVPSGFLLRSSDRSW